MIQVRRNFTVDIEDGGKAKARQGQNKEVGDRRLIWQQLLIPILTRSK